MLVPENRKRAIGGLMLIDMLEEKTQPKKAKRLWVKDWLLKRETNGSFHTLFKELDPMSFW